MLKLVTQPNFLDGCRVGRYCACAGRGEKDPPKAEFLFSPSIISNANNFLLVGAGGEIPTVLGRRRGRP